jgi:hypothetical protein
MNLNNGETILVWNDDSDVAEERIFSSMGFKREKYPVNCVAQGEELNFKNCERYNVHAFAHWKPIPKLILTLSEVAEKFGVPVEKIEIINT